VPEFIDFGPTIYDQTFNSAVLPQSVTPKPSVHSFNTRKLPYSGPDSGYAVVETWKINIGVDRSFQISIPLGA
jgi:hypothetical protein